MINFMGLLDFLFPKYCVTCKKIGSYVCSICFSTISFNDYEKCLVCNRPSFDGLTHMPCKTRFTIDGSFTAIQYKGTVRKLIYTFKYNPYISDIRHTLVDLLYEGVIQKEVFIELYNHYKTNLCLVPVPLHVSKLKKRGYNQSKLLAQSLSKKLEIPVADMLVRVKNTVSQVNLDRKKRQENISGAFSFSPNILVSQYPYIFLVDDVLTTGSTLLEAARVLKKNGAKKVWGIALAQD